MADFVLNRNHTIRSLTGHSVAFKKGIPTNVPHAVIREAVAIGAERVDAGQGQSFEDEEEAARLPAEPEGAEREAAVFTCFDMLSERNAREDFTGQGLPHAKAMQEVLKFAVTTKERDALWTKYNALKAAEE